MIHFPASTGYRTPSSSDTTRTSPGRGGPPQFPPPLSARSAPHTPGSPSRLRFQALHRFHGLHPDFGGSALPVPTLPGETSNDAAGFASRYGPHRRSLIRAFDAGLRPHPFPDETASLLPGLLAATRTGLPPASDDELTNTQDQPLTQLHPLFCWAHETSRLMLDKICGFGAALDSFGATVEAVSPAGDEGESGRSHPQLYALELVSDSAAHKYFPDSLVFEQVFE